MTYQKKLNGVYIFLFFLSFYLLTFSTGQCYDYFNSIDGKVEYEQMQDILKGNFSLLISPRKHLGLSLLQIPFYLAGEFIGRIFNTSVNPPFTLLVNSVVTALSCLLLFLIINLWSNEKTSLIIALLYGLTTLAWPNAKSDTSDPLLTLSVLACFWTLVKFNKTRQNKWFVFSLLFMAAMYITKLIGHVFVLGWLIYVYLVESQNKTPIKGILIKFFWIILVWLIFLPISFNVSKAHSSSYFWSWFKEFWYKISVREFSPLDGLFIYNPIIIATVFSVGKFVKRLKNEFILIVSLILPYFLILHFLKEFASIHDFGSRYDLVHVSLALLMLFPFVENFDSQAKPMQIIFLTLAILGFYTQLLGASIGVLYYANLIGNSLGLDWREYVFSWKFSPFGVYPSLILRLITGIEIPVKGFSNVSASIIPSFRADYFWAAQHLSMPMKLLAIFLFLGVIYLFFLILKRGGFLNKKIS